MVSEELTGGHRCRPCTIANSVVGLLVALVPLVAALVDGSAALVAGTGVWAVVVVGYTGYRLLEHGYLPLAGPVAKLTGLHERIGPGSKTDTDRKGDQ